MAINCDPAALAQNASCYMCITGDAAEAVKLYLLAQIAGLGNKTPEELAKLASCYRCIPDSMQRPVGNYLMCIVAASSGGASRGGSTFGLFSFGNSGASGVVTIDDASSIPGYDIEAEPNITGLVFSNLVAVDPTGLQNGFILISVNPALTSVSFPSLIMVNVTGGFKVIQNPLLTNIDLPNFAPPNGSVLDFSANALSASCVNAILARCVASASFVTGSLDLAAGTNAAPTGQGLLDVVTLTGRGVTVTTNP